MTENMGKWPSKRGPISKIRPSDGSGRVAVPLAEERRYDFPEFGGHPGNPGQIDRQAKVSEIDIVTALAPTGRKEGQ